MARSSPKAVQRSDLIANLKRDAEVLPQEKLRALQLLSDRGALGDEALLKEIGEPGLLLLAFAVAASEEAALLEGVDEPLVQKMQELIARVNTTAPALFKHKRIEATARAFVNVATGEVDPSSLPFDDLSGVRASPLYLGLGDKLGPLLRLQLEFTNRPPLPPLTFRLLDVAFLTSALLGSLTSAVESSEKLIRNGLLDESETQAVREFVKEFGTTLDQLKAALDSPTRSVSAREGESLRAPAE